MKLPAVTQTLEVSYLIYPDLNPNLPWSHLNCQTAGSRRKVLRRQEKNFCERAPKSLIFSPTCVPGFEYAPWFTFLKKTIVNLPIRSTGNSKRISNNSLSPWGAQNKDIGDANRQCLIQTLRQGGEGGHPDVEVRGGGGLQNFFFGLSGLSLI